MSTKRDGALYSLIKNNVDPENAQEGVAVVWRNSATGEIEVAAFSPNREADGLCRMEYKGGCGAHRPGDGEDLELARAGAPGWARAMAILAAKELADVQ